MRNNIPILSFALGVAAAFILVILFVKQIESKIIKQAESKRQELRDSYSAKAEEQYLTSRFNKNGHNVFIIADVVDIPNTQLKMYILHTEQGDIDFKAFNPSDSSWRKGDCVGLMEINAAFDSKSGSSDSRYKGPYYTVVSAEVDGM